LQHSGQRLIPLLEPCRQAADGAVEMCRQRPAPTRETLLPLGHKVVSQTLLEYNAMSAGLFQLLQAKRDQIAAAESYVALVHDYWILRSDVEQLLAGRLTESSAVQTSPGDTPATSSTGSGGH
jgi:hypothetical protein